MFVNTDSVMAIAGEIDSINVKLTDSFSDVESVMVSLRNSWSGEAGEKVMSLFNSLKTNGIEAQKAAVDGYTAFLRQVVADGYVKVENVNIKLSDQFK